VRERAGSVLRLTAPVKAAAQRFALPLLIFISAMLLILGKADVMLFDRLRSTVTDAAAPLLDGVAQPVATVADAVRQVEATVSLYAENRRLREENARLLQWQEVARRLDAENEQLRQLLHTVPEMPASFISSRVIGNSGGAFVRNVLVNAGARDGVARGQAAITGTGLIGRVVEVGDRAARVLLLTDLNSRIPVEIESSHQRAVLAGDNSDRPRLLYLAVTAGVRIGDRVVTSGSGGIFPPELPVGVVASLENGVVRVAPFAELARLEFIRIVDFGVKGMLPPSVVPPPPRPPKGAARPSDGFER
jgi:rod shape-determining protein MreC